VKYYRKVKNIRKKRRRNKIYSITLLRIKRQKAMMMILRKKIRKPSYRQNSRKYYRMHLKTLKNKIK
jgi:hypothetical protein